MIKNGITVAAFLAALCLSGGRVSAQDASDEDIKLFRKDVRSLKKQIIATNMDLSEDEAQKFWPIYDQYAAELTAINDTKFALLKEYVENHDTITNEQAEKYIKARASVEESVMQLRLKYLPLVRKALPGRLVALFFQLDWRLGLVMDLQLASQLPVIEP